MNNTIKWKVLIIAVFVAAAVILAGCSNPAGPGDLDTEEEIPETEEEEPVSVTGVSLDHDSISLSPGSTMQLTATVEPADAADQSVTWSSDNEGVATVKADGLVTGAAEGTATVTVTTTDGGFTAECDVTVYYPPGYSQTSTAGSVTFNMHYVPSGGPFTMGEDVESTTQEVTLTKNFWIGETEVTQGLWEDVWGTTWPGTDPDGSGYGAGAEYPAYSVNWYDAAAFCNLLTQADDSIADTEQVYYSDAGLTTAYTKADAASSADVYIDWSKTGYRLPTEAEWEYAARYIDGTNWNGGDHVSGGPVYTDETDPDKIGDYAWYSGNNTPNGSKEVGQKTANALGLRDMSGNVYEWCYDWLADYSGGSETDPTGPASGSYRVVRGGYWSTSGSYLRCAYRDNLTPSFRSALVGFRLCRTAD